MTITGQRFLTELGNKAWSGFNADDMLWDSEDSLTAKTELNCALRYLFALKDFPFKEGIKTTKTVNNKANYNIPYGQIQDVIVDKQKLVYKPDNDDLDKTEKGKPKYYWIDYKNPDSRLMLNPVPDNNYQLEIKYSKLEPVMDSDFNTKYEFEYATDILNMPDNIAYYFMDCLILKTMEQNNKDDQDENYAPIIKEFNERWNVFKKMAKPVKTETRILWQSL